MKKKLAAIFSTMLVALMLVAVLCGCSTYGSVKSAFENEGYTESQNVQEYQDRIVDYLGENYKDVCTLHIMTKGLTDGVAIICEFKSTEEIDEQIKNSSMLQGAIKDAQNSDYVNGNCLLLPVPVITTSKVVDIFKKA